MGEIYTVEIGFEKSRHCLECPLRENETDGCKLQVIGEDDEVLNFDSWESQMEGCPLKFGRLVSVT